jgi:hypothetical protein
MPAHMYIYDSQFSPNYRSLILQGTSTEILLRSIPALTSPT